jgi:peroxiredoxin family protein
MMGLGTSMMKRRMSAKNVLSVREMMKEAKEFGVRFLACSLPMELMGIQSEELVEEIDEICSIGKYLEEAKDADVNLFF